MQEKSRRQNGYREQVVHSYGEAVSQYKKYAKEMRREGKRPVSFLNFLAGRA